MVHNLNDLNNPTQIHITAESPHDCYDLGALIAIMGLKGIEHEVLLEDKRSVTLCLPLTVLH